MGGRAVEGTGLENRQTRKGFVSSNLTPSAILLRAPRFAGLECPLKRSRMPSEASAKEGCHMHYVYLIRSLNVPVQKYVGLSDDLKMRLKEHNSGKSRHTSKFKPWELVTYIAFTNKTKAEQFEIYLKQGSGHAFAKKRLW
jgi:putative endonuclease